MPVTYPLSISFRDKANSVSTTELNFVNADAITYITGGSGPMDDWGDAVAALSLGTEIRRAAERRLTPVSPSLPTDDNAYNSAKLTVFYHDTTTGKPYRYQIPARKAAAYNTYPGTKNVILTIALGGTAQVEALVTATEAGVSPTGGAIAVDSIVISGGKQSG
jgi:hypothetical protein